MGQVSQHVPEVSSSDATELRRCVLESCIETFADYHLALEPCEEEVAEDSSASFIGFLGPRFRGVFLLVLPLSLVRITCPKSAPPDRAMLLDWSHELCNRVFGRFKNKLAARQVYIDQSLPKLLLEQREIVEAAASSVCALSLGDGREVLHTFVDAFPVRGCERVFEPLSARASLLAEGDTLMF